MCFLPAVAEKHAADSARIYFRQGYRTYEPRLFGNAATMERVMTMLRSAADGTGVDSVIVRAYASPEGGNAANRRLARLRCATIADYLKKNSGLPRLKVIPAPGGIAWDELRRKVVADSTVPYREEVIGILDNKLCDRKHELMRLRGGVPYRWLYRNMFPSLRNALIVSLYMSEETEPAYAPLVTADTVAASHATVPVPADTILSAVEPVPDVKASGEAVVPEISYCQPFALGTNLIYDALLCPNLTLEWRVNNKYSVLAEADVAWWSNDSRHKYYQVMYLGAEGRRWFTRRTPYHGFYVGIMAGGGKYDLENGGEGYKGEGLLAGITGGYTFPIGSRLSLDAGIGLGYMYTRYEAYRPFDGHYIYQRKADTSYFGPIRARLALVWRFGACRKGGAL